MNSPAPVAGPPPTEGLAPPRRWWIWLVLVIVAAGLVVAAWLLMKPDPRRSAPGAVSTAPKAGLTPPAPAAGRGLPGRAACGLPWGQGKPLRARVAGGRGCSAARR
ncbi:MAG: hypothetical protein ACKODG_05210, partial [Betaproteobacteria bacterium]